MKKIYLVMCLMFLFTGCTDKSSESTINEINRLNEENQQVKENVISLMNKVNELENIISSLAISEEDAETEKENLHIDKIKEVKNFTLDMDLWNQYPSNSQRYRVVNNTDGTFLVDKQYKPLERITSEAIPVENCWSKNDENLLLLDNYEWFNYYYVYNIDTDQMIKLFEKGDYIVVGEESFDREFFGFVSHFVIWLDDDKMVFIEGNGLPKDGSEPEYRERGYRSDVFVYDWKTHELIKLTDADDGEYYDCLGLDPTETLLILNVEKYNQESTVIEETMIELPYIDLIY